MARIRLEDLVKGERVQRAGDATHRFALVERTGEQLEDELGFHRGRLAQGWYWLTIIGRPDPRSFARSGTTAFSGGLVNAAATRAKFNVLHMTSTFHDTVIDRATGQARTVSRVVQLPLDHHDSRMRATTGDYEEKKRRFLELLTGEGGEMKIAKVVPRIMHDPNMLPDKQYPAGAGRFQMTFMFKQAWLVRDFVAPGQVLPKSAVYAPGAT